MGSRKTVFRLKIMNLKGAGNDGMLKNLQASEVLFSFLIQRNYFFGT